MAAKKRIPIDDLSIGMYVVGLDRSWLQTPFLVHKRRIKHHDEITLLKQHGIRQVTIDPTRGKDIEPESGPTSLVSEADEHNILPPSSPTLPPPPASGRHQLAVARVVWTEAMGSVARIFDGAKTGGRIDNGAVRKVVHTLLAHILHRHDALLSLIRTRQFDADLFTHTLNVCVFALVVGQIAALDAQQLEGLGIGALLHDIGEMRLPRNLLRKRGAYTAQERQLMQQHPQLGAMMLTHSAGMPQVSCRIVAEHHEFCDGSGYPQQLQAAEISPLSQIVGIAEVYDGMLSSRRGRPGLLPEQAIKRLYQYGVRGQFALPWIQLTIRCLGIYPIGSLVELSTGELAVVTSVHPHKALKPTVKIICDASRMPYAIPRLVHLAAPKPNAPDRVIVHALDPAKEGVNIMKYLNEEA